MIKNSEIVPVEHQPGFAQKLRTLTEKESKYFSIMRGQYGVLYIKAKPGVAKSAIARSIAKKLGLQYYDLRLSMADETDMQFPNLTYREELGSHVIEHAIPEWAVLSNQAPSLIHFEELNRAPLAVRNAALQILLERGIGPKFKFNQNVFMMASGNLGEEDGTDVEEFDNALNNRLIHMEHDLRVEEWLEWGQGEIHPDILSFIELQPTNFYIAPNENSQTYATARSWHMLSEYIVKNFGGGPKVDKNGEFITNEAGEVLHFFDGYKVDREGKILYNTFDDGTKQGVEKPIRHWGDMTEYQSMVEVVARGFVGDTAAVKLIRFLNDRTKVSLKDVLENYRRVEKELAKFNRDKYSELLAEAKKARIDKWSEKEVDNFGEFLKVCSSDERVGFMVHVIDHAQQTYSQGVNQPRVRTLLRKFQSDLVRIKSHNKANKS
jgi:hypothetical protein